MQLNLIQFGIVASTMAMEDAGLESLSFDKNRAGVIIGSWYSFIRNFLKKVFDPGPKSLNPFNLRIQVAHQYGRLAWFLLSLD